MNDDNAWDKAIRLSAGLATLLALAMLLAGILMPLGAWLGLRDTQVLRIGLAYFLLLGILLEPLISRILMRPTPQPRSFGREDAPATRLSGPADRAPAVRG
ncbi:MAG: hypothetical protein WD928_12740 [Gammaproteobacteria bacterium]